MEEVIDLLLPVLVIAIVLFITYGIYAAFGLILGWIGLARPSW